MATDQLLTNPTADVRPPSVHQGSEDHRDGDRARNVSLLARLSYSATDLGFNVLYFWPKFSHSCRLELFVSCFFHLVALSLSMCHFLSPIFFNGCLFVRYILAVPPREDQAICVCSLCVFHFLPPTMVTTSPSPVASRPTMAFESPLVLLLWVEPTDFDLRFMIDLCMFLVV